MIWLENNKLSLKENLAHPKGETLIRVLKAGICNTDLELVKGYYPFTGIPGHEFIGIVEKGPKELIGKRVVGEINVYCGTCEFCLKGLKTHCPNRSVLGIVNHHGAFAPYLTLPVRNLHIIGHSVSDEQATFVEPIAAALQITELVSVSPEDKVLVVGDGKLGQLISQVLALTGCKLLVLGRHKNKLAHLEKFGIKTTTHEASIGGGFDIAVECTGNPVGFDIARKSLRPRGTLVLKSTYAGKLTLDISSIVVDEISIVGTRCGPFDKAIKLLEEKKVFVDYLIDKIYPLERGLEAFEHAAQKGVMKILLDCDKQN